MDNKKLLKNIFVDIDAIFDIRLPLLYTLLKGGSKEFFNVMKTYEERVIDEFNPISKDMFESYYKGLNKAIFKLAAPTEIINLLQQLAIEIKEELVLNNEDYNITLYVNIYPFNFNSNEIINLTTVLQDIMNLEYVKVKLVKMNNEELEPNWIHDNINTIVKYSGLEWLEYQVATYKIIERPLLDTMLIIPALFKGNGEMKKINNSDYNKMFAELTKTSSTLINMNLVKTEYFCTKFK